MDTLKRSEDPAEIGFAVELERRSEPRQRCRLNACVEHAGRTHPAVIETWNRRGLFLRTPFEGVPGSQLLIEVPELEVSVLGRVHFQESVARSLSGLQWAGLGLEVTTLPCDLVARLEGRLS